MTHYLKTTLAFPSEGERSRIVALLAENGYDIEDKTTFLEVSMDPPTVKDVTDVPAEHLAAHYEILLKSARRCAYDLAHAADPGIAEHIDIDQRARDWLDIFAPDGVKNYRLRMHRDILSLESQVHKLYEMAKGAGLNPPPPFFI